MCSVDDTGDVRDERNGNMTDYAMMTTDADTALRILIRRQVFRSRTPVQVLPLWTHRRFDSESDHKVYIEDDFSYKHVQNQKLLNQSCTQKDEYLGKKKINLRKMFNYICKNMFNLIVIGLSFDFVTF